MSARTKDFLIYSIIYIYGNCIEVKCALNKNLCIIINTINTFTELIISDWFIYLSVQFVHGFFVSLPHKM